MRGAASSACLKAVSCAMRCQVCMHNLVCLTHSLTLSLSHLSVHSRVGDACHCMYGVGCASACNFESQPQMNASCASFEAIRGSRPTDRAVLPYLSDDILQYVYQSSPHPSVRMDFASCLSWAMIVPMGCDGDNGRQRDATCICVPCLPRDHRTYCAVTVLCYVYARETYRDANFSGGKISHVPSSGASVHGHGE